MSKLQPIQSQRNPEEIPESLSPFITNIVLKALLRVRRQEDKINECKQEKNKLFLQTI